MAKTDWEGQDISGQTHTGVKFIDLDCTEVVNRGAVFTDCNFQRATFNCSVHTDAAFVNCTFNGCSFFDARFTECKFVGSNFVRCTFDLMQVAGGNWSHVGLSGADLSRAIVRGARLRERGHRAFVAPPVTASASRSLLVAAMMRALARSIL